MYKLLLSMACASISQMAYAAGSGTQSDPFTSLGDSYTVAANGVYYFNVFGTNFSTYVETDGAMLVATEDRNGRGALPQITALTTSTRGILSSILLANFTDIERLRIFSTTGDYDISSTNADVLSRISTFSTISRGGSDAALNATWTGTGVASFVAGSCTSRYTVLAESIAHMCGNGRGFHWIPLTGHQRLIFGARDIPQGNFLRLFVYPGQNVPALSVIKTSDLSGLAKVGDIITYTYTITNIGKTPLTDITISDVHTGFGQPPVPQINTATLTDVAPLSDSSNPITNDNVWDVLGSGDTLTIDAPYLVIQEDIDLLQ